MFSWNLIHISTCRISIKIIQVEFVNIQYTWILMLTFQFLIISWMEFGMKLKELDTVHKTSIKNDVANCNYYFILNNLSPDLYLIRKSWSSPSYSEHERRKYP